MVETYAQISARTGITNPVLLRSIQNTQKAAEPTPPPEPALPEGSVITPSGTVWVPSVGDTGQTPAQLAAAPPAPVPTPEPLLPIEELKDGLRVTEPAPAPVVTDPALQRYLYEQAVSEPKPTPEEQVEILREEEAKVTAPPPTPVVAPPPTPPVPTPIPTTKLPTEAELSQKYGTTVVLTPSNTLMFPGIGDTGVTVEGTIRNYRPVLAKVAEIEKLGLLSDVGRSQMEAYQIAVDLVPEGSSWVQIEQTAAEVLLTRRGYLRDGTINLSDISRALDEMGREVTYTALRDAGFEDVDSLLQQAEALPRLTPEERAEAQATAAALIAAFPEQDIQDVYTYASENPEAFLADVLALGHSPEAEALLYRLFPEITSEQTDWFFMSAEERWDYLQGYKAIGGREIEDPATGEIIKLSADELMRRSIRRDLFPDITDEDLDELIEAMGPRAKPPKPLAIYPEFLGSFVAGIGGLLTATGGAVRWFGETGVGKTLAEATGVFEPVGTYTERLEQLGGAFTATGGELQEYAPPGTFGEFSWEYLYSPQWWASPSGAAATIGQVLPLAVALVIPSIITGGAAAGLVTGTFAKIAMRAIVGGTTSRVLESSMEAGMTFDEALAMGLSPEEAKRAADEVFRNNLALAGVDIGQFAMAFLPAPLKAPSLLIKTAMVAGKMTIIGLTEAGEEAYQEVVQRWALGKTVDLDPEMQQAMSVGFLMGLGLGAGVGVYTAIQQQTIENLPADLRLTFDGTLSDLQGQGLSLEEAQLGALDAIAATPEGQAAIGQAVETIKHQELVKQIKPRTEVDRVVIEHQLGEKLPAPEVGMPEPGIQRAMEELGVPEKVVRPEGPKPTQAVLDIEGERVAWDQAQAELEGIQEFLASDPVASYRGYVGKAKTTLTSILRGADWPETITVKQAEMLLQGRPVKESVKVGDRVRWEYVMDEMSEQFGMTEDQMISHLGSIRQMQRRADALSFALAGAETVSTEQQAFIDEIRSIEGIGDTVSTEASEVYLQITNQAREIEADIAVSPEEQVKFLQEGLTELRKEQRILEKAIRVTERQTEAVKRANILKQTTMSWSKVKGIPEGQMRDIFSKTTGHRQLHLMTEQQLIDTLKAIKQARPKNIRGRRVITPKTEGKIQTLKRNLIADRAMTDEIFGRLQENLGLRTTGYETATRFITESEGKAFIRAMNDEAQLAELQIKVDDAMARNPDLKAQWDALDSRIAKEGVTFEGEPAKVHWLNDFRSARFYYMLLQKKIGAPIYTIWQKVLQVHQVASYKRGLLQEKLKNSTPEYKAIQQDEAALTRIEDYIAAKHNMGPKSPPNITPAEIRLANVIEEHYFGRRNDVRYHRFVEAYQDHDGNMDVIASEIPDAPRRALRRALDVYESQGGKGLRKFTDTQEWGVIRSGYDPAAFVKPGLKLWPTKATTFGKGHLKTRRGVEFQADDRNIIQRLNSYEKQMIGLTDMAPWIRTLDRTFTENAHKITNSGQVAQNISKNLNEAKGYRESGGAIVYMIQRMYGQVASAVFWRPDLVLRNKFQNLAFNKDWIRGYAFDPRNKPMSAERRAWMEIFIYQERGIKEDYMFTGLKPLPLPPPLGLGPFTERVVNLARRTSLFPWSDRSNRDDAFMVRANVIDRALKQYRKDGDVDALIKNAHLTDLELLQQQEALELLAMDEVDYGLPGMPAVSGEEAFARYAAQQHVLNVHFAYDRTQRSMAEQAPAGIVLGNIMTFQRSWGERLLLQGNKLRPGTKATFAERKAAAFIVVGIVVAGFLAGEAYRRITGKRNNPYNVLNILTWSPGGLMVGVFSDISEGMYAMTQAVQGDKTMLGKFTGMVPNVADLCLPFYKFTMQGIEAATGTKNLDKLALRKLREAIDSEYKTRGGAYKVDRNLVETLQHALFGGEAPPASTEDKVKDYEKKLGEIVEDWADLPFSIEEPDVYDMKDLKTDLGRLLKVGDEGHTVLSKAYVEMLDSRVVYESMPTMPLYEIDNFDIYYQQWQEIQSGRATLDDYPKAYLGNFGENPRRILELLEEYHSLDESEQKAFLEEHSELKVDPQVEWLKANPEENAKLALWGQAKILTEEAYDAVQKLITDLDIPDSAVLDYLPPEGAVQEYFDYQDAVAEFGANSAEAKLIVAQSDILREHLEREEIETPIKALEISAEWREMDDQYELAEDTDAFLAENPEYHAARRERDAYNIGFSENLIPQYVDWYTTERLGWEGDWYLIENQDFYNEMVSRELWKERDFSKVPTRSIATLLDEREAMRTEDGKADTKARKEFEALFPEVDAYMHIVHGNKLEETTDIDSVDISKLFAMPEAVKWQPPEPTPTPSPTPEPTPTPLAEEEVRKAYDDIKSRLADLQVSLSASFEQFSERVSGEGLDAVVDDYERLIADTEIRVGRTPTPEPPPSPGVAPVPTPEPTPPPEGWTDEDQKRWGDAQTHGIEIDTPMMDSYVEYWRVPSGKARLVYRHENPEFETWLVREFGYTPVGDRWE